MKNIKELNKEFKQLDIELFDCATEIVSYRRKIESIENKIEEIKKRQEEVRKERKLIIEQEKIKTLNITSFNLFEMKKEENTKKIPMTIYFEKEDLLLLKAIAKFKNTSVNKLIMYVLEDTINNTMKNLPDGFDIEKLAKEYDKR